MGNLVAKNNKGHKYDKQVLFDAEHLFCKFCFADEMEKVGRLLLKVY